MFESLFKEPPVVWREAGFAFASGWSAGALGGALLLAALIISLSLWRAPLARGRKILVGALQLLVAAVALTMVWRPALELERTRAGENTVAWLVDDSASMDTADVDGGGTRRDAVLAALGEEGLLEDTRFNAQLVAVGEDARALDSLAELPPVSSRSGLVAALESRLGDVGDAALAAVVLLSDGADNVGGADAAWWRRLAAAGVPVHTVGVGRAVDDVDVELAGVDLPDTAVPEAPVRARLRIVHGAREAVRLRVSAGDTLLLAEDIALDAGATETVRTVAFDAGEAGLKRLDFTLSTDAADSDGAALPPESNLVNNRQTRVLDVRAAPRRVLYVEGEPRWEYKFLRRALEGDPGIEIVSLLRTSPNKFYRQGVRDGAELADGFPRTREALFAYDAVIIGSLPATELDGAQQAALRDFVSVRGGSLLMLAGRQGLADGGWARSALASALPVTLDARLGADTFRRKRARVLPTRQGLRAPWLRLADDDADSLAAWSSLPEVADRQALGVPKPGARVLLELDDGAPLLAEQRYGRGTSLVLGTGGTWRWQMGLPSEDQRHERFWQGLLGEMVVRSLPRLELATDGAVVRDATSVALVVDARDADFTPLETATLQARVTTPSGETRALGLVADVATPGRYTASVALDADGPWGVEVATPPEGESPAAPPARVERWLLRESGTAESFGARQQQGFLERVASASGGRYVPLEDIDTLPAILETDNAALKRAELLPLWNMPLFFVLLFVAKGGEWLLRLRWKRL